MGLRTVCIDIVNTTTVVVLFCIFVYNILIQLYDLGPPRSEKEKQVKSPNIVSHPLHPPRRGLGV